MGKPCKDLPYGTPRPYPRLTDEAAGYDAPSAAAMAVAKDVIVTIQESYGIEYKAGEPVDEIEWRLWATTLDRFAAQQAAAAVKERDAEIIAALEQQKIPPPLMPRIAHYNGVLGDAIGIIRKL